MGMLVIDGLTFGYDDVGQGPPLVLIHGHPFDRSMWQPQVAYFARDGWRVIAPDLRGYGDSAVVAGMTTLDTFARDIAALLDRLDVADAVLCGLSMGGQIVMEFYRQFPDRVRALVLADTFAEAETASGRKLRNDTADRLLREGMAPFAQEALPRMLAERTIREQPAVVRHVLRMMCDTNPAGAAAALRGRAERPDYVELLGRIAVPTLVVVGEYDEFTTIQDAHAMCERIPDGALVVVHDAGHMPNLEQPDAFNEEVARFLGGVRAAV